MELQSGITYTIRYGDTYIEAVFQGVEFVDEEPQFKFCDKRNLIHRFAAQHVKVKPMLAIEPESIQGNEL